LTHSRQKRCHPSEDEANANNQERLAKGITFNIGKENGSTNSTEKEWLAYFPELSKLLIRLLFTPYLIGGISVEYNGDVFGFFKFNIIADYW